MPQAGTEDDNQDLKQKAYDELEEATQSLREQDVVITTGDFNARLKYRYAHETDFIGKHWQGPGKEALEKTAPQTTLQAPIKCAKVLKTKTWKMKAGKVLGMIVVHIQNLR